MTERMTRPRGETALLFLVTAALLTAIVLLACGPAADDGEKEGDPAASAVPTATPKGDEPTKTPEPTPSGKANRDAQTNATPGRPAQPDGYPRSYLSAHNNAGPGASRPRHQACAAP